MNFFIKTEYNIIFFIVIMIVSVLIAFYYYRKSNLDRNRRILFTVLRSLTLFFLLMLLAAPVISFISVIQIEPVNIFLIDNSKSLELESRNRTTDSLYNNVIKNVSGSGAENKYFTFSKNLDGEIADSIRFYEIDNNETNLTSSMVSLEELYSSGNIATINIVSDGMLNEGGNPLFTARTLNAPISYMLVGDTAQKNDIVIKDVFYNKSAFVESTVPIKIEINSFKYSQNLTLNLYEEDKLLTSQNIAVTPDKVFYNADFNVTSLSPGIKKYKAELVPLDGEITNRNNSREFFIKFIDNKFKALVLSGGPSYDNAFIKEEIQKIQNFETTFLTQKSPGSYYEGAVPDLSQFRVFILIGYPTSISNNEILSQIESAADNNNASIFFFASKNTDYSKLALIQDKLPFRAFDFSSAESETGIKTVSIIDNEAFGSNELLASVNNLPAVFKGSTNFTANPSSETILLTASSEPAFVIQSTEDNHSAAFLVHGLYKWRLSPRKTNGAEVLSYLMSTTIAYIADKNKQKKFFIETTRPVYSKYEEVVFTATLNNPEVIGGEVIKVKVNGNGINNEIELTKTGNTTFEGRMRIPNDGDYTYTASLNVRDQFVESDEGRFIIGENNYEFINTRADNSLLSSLANETGGMDFTRMSPDEISRFLSEKSENASDEIESLKNFSLNINPYFLSLLILMLCIEWFFRKRNNLP